MGGSEIFSPSTTDGPSPTAVHRENLARLFKPGPYHLTMGFRPLDDGNWLTVDEQYRFEHALRAYLLDSKKGEVLQCLLGSEAACREALELVVEFLTKAYPKVFEFYDGGKECVHNNLTGELVRVLPPYNRDSTGAEMGPLEVAARLAMEDFNILIKGDTEGGGHCLRASATLFPAGWRLQERIGWSVAELHGSVPKWKDRVALPVERYLSRINKTNSMERSNFFVQTTMNLFHPSVFPSSTTDPLRIEDVVIRHERQTFCHLPDSGAVLFTVRTYIDKLQNLPRDQLLNFAAAVRALPDDFAEYKGRGLWGEVVLKFCDEGTK